MQKGQSKVHSDTGGWEQAQELETLENTAQLHLKKVTLAGNNILAAQHHSLKPDMLFGWKPKLSCCPIPLTYRNTYLDTLAELLLSDDRFRITYVSSRPTSSVQVNQQYQYFWKHRERYSLNDQKNKENTYTVEPLISKLEKAKLPSQFSFNSGFESGNLQLAVRVKRNEYDCFIRSDTNTRGHTNWYYFRVQNCDEVGVIQINVCNLGKSKNLYNKGMRPYVLEASSKYPAKTWKEEGKAWSQEKTFDVCFVERFCRYGSGAKLFQLQFKYSFKQKNQIVYFAYAIPYTYSRLETFIKQIQTNYPEIVQTSKLCETLGGLNVPLLTITNEPHQETKDDNDNESQKRNQSCPKLEGRKKGKKAVLVTGRIHPGEANASHTLQGFISALLKDSKISNQLRDNFIFYILPMLNPDGVVAGNFRTSYSGKDLNRQFSNLNKNLFPEVTYLCQLVESLRKKHRKGVEMYLDFHGHSSKKGLFCYGPQHSTTRTFFFKCRAFAKLVERMTPIFSYRSSIFTISEHKKTTGRAFMLWKAKIPLTFTFQISNGLWEKEGKALLLDQSQMNAAGQGILSGLHQYYRLEMRAPITLSAKAKVDSGINPKKKAIKSTNVIRSHSLLKKPSANLTNGQLPPPKPLKPNSLKIINSKTLTLKQDDQLYSLFKEIKRQYKQSNEQQIQGGSDSEGSEQDLNEDEASKLFQDIRGTYESLKPKKARGSCQLKAKKVPIIQEQVEPQTKQNNKKERPLRAGDLTLKSYAVPPRPPASVEISKVVLMQKNFTMDI